MDEHVGRDDVICMTQVVRGEGRDDLVKALGRYDTELQMFAEPPHDPCEAHLGFLRWLAEQGRFEPDTMSAEYVSDDDDLDARARAA